MCDVMPTISEDGGPGTDRDSNYSGDESNFEQLMVNMLDERDRLMETLRESQESLAVTQAKLQEAERDSDAFQKQLSATQPQVFKALVYALCHFCATSMYLVIFCAYVYNALNALMLTIFDLCSVLF